MLNNRDK